MSTLGHVAERFNAMVTDEAQAAYWRTYIKEYRIAWSKSWPKLCEMLDIGEKERAYAKPSLEDGIPQPVYQTFEDFCEAEVEPFVGPVACLREQYRRYKNGDINIEEGAKQIQGHRQVIAGRENLQRYADEIGKMESENIDVTDQSFAERAGISRAHAHKVRQKLLHGLSTGDKPCSNPTKQQRADALGISRFQLFRLDCVARHPDLQHRTELPNFDPEHLSIRAAYTEVCQREGRQSSGDPIEPIWRSIMKLNKTDLNRLVERYNQWKYGKKI